MSKITNLGTEPITIAVETHKYISVINGELVVSTEMGEDVVTLNPGQTMYTDVDKMVAEGKVRTYERQPPPPLPNCKCGKWSTYVGAYDEDGNTVRCHGCLRAIAKCTCM